MIELSGRAGRAGTSTPFVSSLSDGLLRAGTEYTGFAAEVDEPFGVVFSQSLVAASAPAVVSYVTTPAAAARRPRGSERS